ncbi:hypothetical protein GCM10023189_55000 [Nibrella saemangeumensis]|uniref:Lipoprotein with Yx(FWY)xxD motif n=1 Tax=Nibrella saemangeumensis TaxID=1084526 RepID=A0ABP8NLG3_9BACT
MITFTHLSRVLVAVTLVAAAVVACNNGDTTTPQPDVALGSTTLGNVLVGENGRTLYFFSADADGNSACAGACKDTWPVFYKENLRLSSGLDAADFTTLTRPDGTKQTAYKGWPLYYYQSDTQAGDIKGENVSGVWFVAKPDYSIMIARGQLKGHDGKTYTSTYQEGTGNTLYFVDGLGRTIYGFVNDKKNSNNFTKADFTNNSVWPLVEDALKQVPSTVDKSLFGTIQVAGHNQLTFKGWPLYYFGQDNNQRGSTKGVSFPKPGVWPVVNKDTPEAP